jgi:beta-N-acetylhexosaminidase
VADLHANPYNPIVCTRSLGDDAGRVGEFATALVESMEANGIAACVKHFPGDGWDDRDQHVCTSVNPLSADDWFRLSGKPFADAIAAGVRSVMIGHVALPAIDPGKPDDPLGPPPASMSRKIVTGLLRERMGFEGVVITDALEMGGLVSRMRSHRELIVEVVNAGCDVLLFSVAREDFGIIVDAVQSGEIPQARIDEAVSRILALKEWLGFARDPALALPLSLDSPLGLPSSDPPSPEATSSSVSGAPPTRPGESPKVGFELAATQVARKAMTLVRDCADRPRLKPGDAVLAIHLRSNPEYNIDGFDGLLAGEGFRVTRKTEADLAGDWLSEESLRGYAAIFFLWNMGPTWGTADIRPGGPFMRLPWFLCMRYPSCPVLHVSFGYPYLLHDLPWAQYLLNAYSPDIHSQRAALDVILGRRPALGKSPVDLARPDQMREILAREITGGR